MSVDDFEKMFKKELLLGALMAHREVKERERLLLYLAEVKKKVEQEKFSFGEVSVRMKLYEMIERHIKRLGDDINETIQTLNAHQGKNRISGTISKEFPGW